MPVRISYPERRENPADFSSGGTCSSSAAFRVSSKSLGNLKAVKHSGSVRFIVLNKTSLLVSDEIR